jgi:hypothetical protein
LKRLEWKSTDSFNIAFQIKFGGNNKWNFNFHVIADYVQV